MKDLQVSKRNRYPSLTNQITQFVTPSTYDLNNSRTMV